jgi:serine/threonine protein kinase/Tol biopolymer transport system component
MALADGTRLEHYEIIEPLGAGGMGEVYRAVDTKLRREVAIKILPPKFAADPSRLVRFEREAHLLAALNHPNIAAIYGLEHIDGIRFLVLELVEGPTLSERLKSGPMEVGEALGIAAQIAEALEAAHEKGVVHRDLKPGNVKITPAGKVKVLDFGLAKALGDPEPASASSNPEAQSTATLQETKAGVVMGTAAYMSPEQAEGKPTDKRSDVWSFGVVLYEMLSGKRCFEGKTTSHVLLHVLEQEPDWEKFPGTVSIAVRHLLERCLTKDPALRLRDIGDLRLQLQAMKKAPASVPAQVPGPARKSSWLWPVVAAGMIVAGAALALWAPWRKPTPTQAVRFEVGPSEKMAFINQAAMAVSPDGRWMVFPALGEDGLQHYYIRALDGVEVRALPGADGGQSPASWSYDSRWVVFVVGGKLKKVDIQGGAPQNIADFPITNRLGGADWNRDGVIIAGADGSPVLQVPAAGGQLTSVTALAPGDSTHRWPQFLPDGRHFLYQRISSDAAKTGVYIGSIDVKPNEQSMQRLLASDRQAYYAPAPGGGTGRLIFLRGSALMAQPFDPNEMTLSGEPTSIVDGVDSFAVTNHGLFSVSNTGTLVYRGGTGAQTVLTWFDQQGNSAGTLGDPGDYSSPAISPDGSRAAVAMGPQASRDIWILDVARGASTRFTFDPARDDFPAWSPDGKNIAFSSNRGGQLDLYIKPSDNSAEEKLLLKTDEPKSVERWTKDGRFLLFDSIGPKTAYDMWALPFPGEAKPVSLLQTQFVEIGARVSPDGRWLAYLSTESGPSEIYVRPFTPQAPAGTGAKWLVSKGSGVFPIWRADGKGLFYLTLASQVMAVDIDTSKGFEPGTPRRMFTAPTGATITGWDLSPDGKRFLFAAPPNTGRTIPFTVVLNWTAGLKK